MATIRSIMQTQLVVVQPDTPVRDAINLLIENGISGLPVVDASRRIVGVLSEKDLLKVFYDTSSGPTTVEKLMTRSPITIGVDAPLVEIFDCLMTHDFRRVLIEEKGKLVGLVSRADLMPTLLEELAARSGG